MPQDKEMSEVSELVENLAISNRLIVLVSDSIAESPDVLVQTKTFITLRPAAHLLIRVIAHDIDQFRSEVQAYSAAV